MFWAHGISRLDQSAADGIHLIWSPPLPAGYSAKGFDIWRRDGDRERPISCYSLTGGEQATLEQFFTIKVPPARISLVLAASFSLPRELPDEPFEEGREFSSIFTDDGEGGVSWKPASIPLHPKASEKIFGWRRLDLSVPFAAAHLPPRVYHIDFDEPCAYARIEAYSHYVLAVALLKGKAVDARAIATGSGAIAIEFRRPLDRISLYTLTPLDQLRICRDVKQDRGGWRLIAEGIQVPFSAVNGDVGSLGDEWSLVKARRLPGETLSNGDFADLSVVANATLSTADQVAPTHLSLLTRHDPAEPFVELQPWRYVLALTLEAAWRRSLGFSYVDSRDLSEGRQYDYRIVGHFRARDTAETFLGFHMVPLDATLPLSFRLGAARFSLPRPTTVTLWPRAPFGTLRHVCRKGIEIAGECTIEFASPITRIALEFEPAAEHDLSFAAATSGFILGLPLVTESGRVSASPRVELSFSRPIDCLRLIGRGLLYGLRLALQPSGADPDKLISARAEIAGIVFEKTQAPPAPAFLGTVNLQVPPSSAPPSGIAHPPLQPIGFRVSWPPPPPHPAFPAGFWPNDIASAPPTEIAGYALERRRVDTGGGYQPFDPDGRFSGDTILLGGRSAPYSPQNLAPGDDLLAVFPEAPAPTPPVPIFASVDDVLHSPSRPHSPPPGTLHQYRIFSIDLIGRRSDLPAEGSIVRLEKRAPPPLPAGPPLPAVPQETQPKGVRARAIQANAGPLSPGDAALIGTRANAVVLEWGWAAEERRQDPFAREFRVYWRSDLPDEIQGELIGPVSVVGGVFRLSAKLDRPVELNQFAGQYIRAGGYPFRIAQHGAGTTMTVDFYPSALDPGRTPAPAPFTMAVLPRAKDLRPAAWQERTAVIPITAAESYRFVFYDRFSVDALNPRTRGWVGVSAADDQPYIPDALPSGLANGGRPGNEGGIAAASWTARYVGQPVFNVPPPLPDVPEIVLPEVSGDEVLHFVDAPVLLPGAPRPANHRFQAERANGADVFSLMSVRPDGAIVVCFPDGSSQSFTHAHSGDQTELVAAMRTGEPGRIANRFLMDIAIRFDAQLAPLWQPIGTVGLNEAVTDQVPNKPERFLYRLRLIDRAGHRSAGTALVPRVFRVPSLRAPGTPDSFSHKIDDDVVSIEVTVQESYDLSGIILFTHVLGRSDPFDGLLLNKADLLRLSNRWDLGPTAGIRVRLADGTLLAPVFVDRGAAVADGRRLTFRHDLAAGYDKRVLLWVSALTRDRLPSLLLGPRNAATAAAPPAVPALTVLRAGGDDLATWTMAAAESNVAIERSVDGGASWARCSPWIAAGAGEHRMLAPPAGPRSYRLCVRSKAGREAVGPAISA